MSQLALRTDTLKAGSTGRQGVSGVIATVFGATGFLGRYTVSNIGEEGGRVICPHRCDDLDMQHLRPMGDLGNIIPLQDFSIRDGDFIKKSISKSNVVINLVGQYTETWNYNFEEVCRERVPRSHVTNLCVCTLLF
jgi:NADH dehydrogenase (ubiquinone) 1 alpha subcomplex subunit 9